MIYNSPILGKITTATNTNNNFLTQLLLPLTSPIKKQKNTTANRKNHSRSLKTIKNLTYWLVKKPQPQKPDPLIKNKKIKKQYKGF